MIELVPEHLSAADSDAAAVLIDDTRDQIVGLLAPVLRALGLRVDDHVSEEDIVSGGVVEIVHKCLGAIGAVLLEDVDAHALTDQRRGDVIRRAAHETVGDAGPRLQGLAALHHLLIGMRHLPGSIDAAV